MTGARLSGRETPRGSSLRTGAPRPRRSVWCAAARGAAVMLALVAASPVASEALGTILDARLEQPVTRYDHGVLGDSVEWGTLRLWVDRCPACARTDVQETVIRLPRTRVFEDVEARLIGLDPKAPTAVMVVESDLARGARLSLYTGAGLLAATPFIGQTHRWLAPVGAADLDGDGALEVAYVDRPHLAKVLRVWRLEGDTLTEVAALENLTNHRIGWDTIAGGLRDCGAGPEMVLASGDWSRLMAVRLDGGGLSAREIGRYDVAALEAALACR